MVMESIRKIVCGVRRGLTRCCCSGNLGGCNSGAQCWKSIKSRLPGKKQTTVYSICFFNLVSWKIKVNLAAIASVVACTWLKTLFVHAKLCQVNYGS